VSRGFDVDRDFLNPLADGFKVMDHLERLALPVFVRVIEVIAIVGDLTQLLPVLAAVPGKSELRHCAGDLRSLVPPVPSHGP
jgi:hypothetical protein